MTKRNLYDLTMLLLGYSTTDKKVDERVIWRAADMVRGVEMVKYLQQFGDTARSNFAIPLTLSIQTDTTRNMKYVDIGTQVLGMDNSRGIISISLQQDLGSFIISTREQIANIQGLEVSQAAGQRVCWVEGTKVWLMNPKPQWVNLLVVGIPTLESLGYDDQIPQPQEFNLMLSNGARELLQERKQTDENLNNDTA